MRKFVLAIGLILLLYGVHLWESPRSFVVDFAIAVREKDADRVCGYIDFSALQRNMARRGAATLARDLETTGEMDAETARRQAESLADKAARDVVTCDGMRDSFSGGAPGTPTGPALFYGIPEDAEIDRDGLLAFSMKKDGSILRFSSTASGWKLTDIEDAP